MLRRLAAARATFLLGHGCAIPTQKLRHIASRPVGGWQRHIQPERYVPYQINKKEEKIIKEEEKNSNKEEKFN
jgi:hypothetical protein